jgi:hypothetical protein
MLEAVGFRRVEQVWPTSPVQDVARAGRRLARVVAGRARGSGGERVGFDSVRQGRVVFHAYR